MIPIMDVLQWSSQPATLLSVLCLVNKIVAGDKKSLERVSLLGMIPVIVRFTRSGVPRTLRREAARFVESICTTSLLALQMFISCGGVPVLVDFLNPDAPATIGELSGAGPAAAGAGAGGAGAIADGLYSHVALDGICRVFKLETIPRNDFYRLFVKAGILPRLVRLCPELKSALCTAARDSSAASEAILRLQRCEADSNCGVVRHVIANVCVLCVPRVGPTHKLTRERMYCYCTCTTHSEWGTCCCCSREATTWSRWPCQGPKRLRLC